MAEPEDRSRNGNTTEKTATKDGGKEDAVHRLLFLSLKFIYANSIRERRCLI